MTMKAHPSSPVIENVRRALGKRGEPGPAPRPEILPPRQAGDVDHEIDLLLREINLLSGQAQRLSVSEIEPALSALVQNHQVKKAVLWSTPGLTGLGIPQHLESMGVELLSPQGSKHDLASCDLGITEVDFALPETGTIGLLSSPEKPGLVSLLPRVHLAILHPGALRADLHQVFSEVKAEDFLVFITGPSRTADIELTVTLGVHGPKSLLVWCLP